MSIIRKIKLNSLGYYEFNDSEKELVEFIKNNILNLTEVTSEKYPNTIFYFKNKELYYEYNLNSKQFSFNKYDIWDNVFNFKYNISNIFEKILKINNISVMFNSKTKYHIEI